MKILLVDDDTQTIETFKEYAATQEKKVDILPAKSIEDASNKILNENIDVAIVDMKLSYEDDGNKIIDKINELSLRVPTVVYTGTPNIVSDEDFILKVFTRGEDSCEVIFDYLFSIYDTGVVNILGKRGIFEENLNKVFLQNIIPVLKRGKWIQYGKYDAEKTEKALLRYVLNHLLQRLDNNDGFDMYYPEEMYIYPPVDDKYRTGSIVKEKDNDNFFIILSPACDLALHGSSKRFSFKTDRVLVAEIKKLDEITRNMKQNDKKETLKCIYKNTYAFYYHWLPKTEFFTGGLINFRRLSSYKPKAFADKFENPCIQISPFFCKDIVSRFSSYYARQGQPDINIGLYEKHNGVVTGMPF